MTFTRYEIRWHYEDGEMEYVPFDTLNQAKEYAKANKCSSDNTINMTCAIYKVILHSDFEETIKLEDL